MHIACGVLDILKVASCVYGGGLGLGCYCQEYFGLGRVQIVH